jgi:FixJ family two-component response regulator
MRKVVAIVDDSPEMLNSLDRLLRTADYETELFSSGGAFLDGAAASAAACAVIDIHLGDMSGFDVGQELAARGLTFPTIFMTGSADRVMKQKAVDAGCIAFLIKPFPADLLIDSIERAFQAAGLGTSRSCAPCA